MEENAEIKDKLEFLKKYVYKEIKRLGEAAGENGEDDCKKCGGRCGCYHSDKCGSMNKAGSIKEQRRLVRKLTCGRVQRKYRY